MARKSTATPPSAQIAAGQVIVDKELEIYKGRFKARNDAWQNEAWEYHDNIGELHYVTTYKANAYRRLRLRVVRMQNGEPVDIVESGPAVDALEELRNDDGTHGELLARLSTNLEVPGEGHLVGYTDSTAKPIWKIASNSELLTINPERNEYELSEDGSKRGRPLDYVARIWQPHNRYGWLADSPMRGVLEICDELLILNRTIRSAARSRVASAGILFIPDEATFGPADPTTGEENGNAREDPFTATFTRAITTAIKEEGSAVAAAPIVVRMSKDLIASVKHVTFDRPLDPQYGEVRSELIRRLAQGIDFPPEIMLGQAASNHWTAWLIDDSTWDAHLEPRARMMVNALTSVYLRPRVPSITDQAIWFDAADVLEKPDRLEDAIQLYDRIEISGDALRRYGNFSEEDAPTPEEATERLLREQAKKGPQLDRDQPPAIRASGKESLGRQLLRIDQRVFERLSVQADASVFRALEVAGAAIRRKLGQAKQLKDIPQYQVASTIGRERVITMGLDEDQLIAGTAEVLLERYDTEVDRAHRQLLNVLSKYGVNISTTLLAQLDAAKLAGRHLLEQEFVLTVSAQLYAPDDFMGEGPGESFSGRMSPGSIRKVMAAAGGAGLATAHRAAGNDQEIPWDGIGVGALATEELAEVGATASHYVWLTGSPEHPFDPHQALDGYEFTSFTDEGLQSDGSWPDVDFYFPGDHDTCQCDWYEEFIDAEGEPV